MNVVTRGFTGRRRDDPKLPPGQYLEHGFPVLQAGPTPSVDTRTWQFTITTPTGIEAQSYGYDTVLSLRTGATAAACLDDSPAATVACSDDSAPPRPGRVPVR